MTATRLILGLPLLAMGSAICPAADQKKDEVVELPPWKHEYYWEEFTLSKESPESEDGRYRLKSVRKDGDVELFYSPTPEEKKLIVVKPMPKEFKRGVPLPALVVKTFDAAKQVAIIRELRIK